MLEKAPDSTAVVLEIGDAFAEAGELVPRYDFSLVSETPASPRVGVPTIR